MIVCKMDCFSIIVMQVFYLKCFQIFKIKKVSQPSRSWPEKHTTGQYNEVSASYAQ